MSRSAIEFSLLRLVILKTPCGQRVITREAEKRRLSRFAARKARRGIEGRRVWKVASGTWENCGVKAFAGVGRIHSSGEAGVMLVERRGSSSKRKRFDQMGASRLTAKSYTEEEIREIAARQGLVGYPHLALMREKLLVKAKNEPKSRFHNLKRLVMETETLKCACAQVRANKGAPRLDGVTIEDSEQSEGGVEGFIAGIQKKLHGKTYRVSPVRRKYIISLRTWKPLGYLLNSIRKGND